MLGKFVRAQPRGLDMAIGGSEGVRLSAAQRQLLCLARALLRDARILAMDEATSALDVHTESVVQQMMRTRLAGTTVIKIASRLRSVLRCDRVFVMDEGQVLESGAPAALREKEGGRFRALIESGALEDS